MGMQKNDSWAELLGEAITELEWSVADGRRATARRPALLRLVTRRVHVIRNAGREEEPPRSVTFCVDVRHPQAEFVGRLRLSLLSASIEEGEWRAEYLCDAE